MIILFYESLIAHFQSHSIGWLFLFVGFQCTQIKRSVYRLFNQIHCSNFGEITRM